MSGAPAMPQGTPGAEPPDDGPKPDAEASARRSLKPMVLAVTGHARVKPEGLASIEARFRSWLEAAELGRPVIAAPEEAKAAIAGCTDHACTIDVLSRAPARAVVLVHVERVPGRRDQLSVTTRYYEPSLGLVDVRAPKVATGGPDTGRAGAEDKGGDADGEPAEATDADGAAVIISTTDETLTESALGPVLTALEPRLPAPPAPTSMLIAVNVDDAEVTLDDRALGVSPIFPVEVPPGPHQLTVTKAGFAPFTAEVMAKEGATTRVNADLRSTGPALATAGAGSSDRDEDPLYTRWYVIAGGAAAVVAAAVVIGVAASGGDDEGRGAFPVGTLR